MRKFRRPTCPYCGRKVNPIRTWKLKLEGEYKCIGCHGISNIVLDPMVTIFASIAIVLSILIFLFYYFLVGEITLNGILFMILPYVLFFFISLFLVRLKRPIVRNQVRTQAPPRRRPPEGRKPYSNENMDHTRVL